MSIQDWVISAGTKGLIKDCEKDGRIQEAVNVVEAVIRGFAPSDHKVIKQMLVQYCVFPFCKLLLKDDPDGYKKSQSAL